MNVKTYCSILKWRGEIDPSSDKEFGRKIYDKDIELGKTVWVNNKLKDFTYYLFYYDPVLSMLSNVKYEWNEVFIVLLFILNMSSILATLTASVGFNEMSNKSKINNNNTNINGIMVHTDTLTEQTMDVHERLLMILCASFNGIILCLFQLKWRQFERKKNQKLATFIINQNGITIIMFTLMALALWYYFVMNELNFYSWFLTVYAFQFIFGWSFEIFVLYVLFIRGWKRDHLMVQLRPTYDEHGSFSNFALPKCVYYITYKDYEEWMQYKNRNKNSNQLQCTSIDCECTDESDDEQLGKPLLDTARHNTHNAWSA